MNRHLVVAPPAGDGAISAADPSPTSPGLGSADATEARQRVDRIRIGVESVWYLIVESYRARDWEALGYASWDDMCTREFGSSRLRLPREDRAETIGSLRDAGLSLRAISAATGVSEPTVRRTLAAAPASYDAPAVTVEETAETSDEIDARLGEIGHERVNRVTGEIDAPLTEAECEAIEQARTGQKITGIDGKTYTPSRPTSPRRKPLPDEFRGAVLELGSKTERITRLAQDDRFNSNADQIRQTYLSDLIRARDALQRVIDQLN